MVEAGHFIDFGLRHAQFLRQRGQVGGGQAAVVILDQVQMLDQQVAPARCVAQQHLYFGERGGVDPAAFWGFALALFGGALCALHRNRNNYLVHCFSSQLNGFEHIKSCRIRFV